MTQVRPREEFASDNTAGICPEAMAALEEANRGVVTAYGDDEITARVYDRVREIFETDCAVYFVFNGTAANALALAQLCQPFHSIICHRLAHIQTDECGAPEFFTGGSKLVLVDSDNGKVQTDRVQAILADEHGVHSHKPRVISITQATELGTVYSCDEISVISEFARTNDLLVHMDGARFANALASLNCAPKAVTWQAGVDVLCLGGTKNGVGAGELVVFFRRELARDFEYRVKQMAQLGSKTRFLAAPWLALLTGNVWLRNAAHANAAAKKLAQRIERETNLRLVLPVQSNSIFVRLSDAASSSLTARGWNFYKFIEPDVYRLMCSWATVDDDMDVFVREIKSVLATS